MDMVPGSTGSLSLRSVSENITPVLMGGAEPNLKTEQGDAFLASAMFDGDVADGDERWSPLFEPSAVSPEVNARPLVETQFAREERSAIVMGERGLSASPSLDGSSSSRGLPPIVVKDPSNPASIRRARNTEAARRSRAKKNARIDQLEAVVEHLRWKNERLEAEISVLRRLHGVPPDRS